MESVSNVVSIAEWRRTQRRLDRLTLPELAMSTHSLIDVMIDLANHVEELQKQVDSLSKDSQKRE